jgi:cytoskeletal protein RodZ
VDDSAAHRRRVFLGVIMVVAFALLVVAALIPSPRPQPLSLEQAGADETVPADSSSTDAPDTTAAPTTPSTPAPSTTVTTEAPVTTTTTRAPAKTAAVVKQAVAAKPSTPTTVAPAPPPPSIGPSDAEFLACIRMRESHNDYTAVSASGNYRGAYQFNQPAWDSTARHAGRPDLVGRLANTVAPADQDALALDLYHWQGAKPWNYACT